MTFAHNAPAGLFRPGISTYQGVYCMTADGDFLSGYFAWAFRDRAKRTIKQGWQRWEQLARKRDYKSKPVPRTPIDYYPFKAVKPGGLTLQAAVRDLPRGPDAPKSRWHPHTHNLNWIGLTPSEAQALVTIRASKTLVATGVLEKLATQCLKDNVRGQCSGWKKTEFKKGSLFTECVKREGDRLTLRITGTASMSNSQRAYSCQLHGRVVYDAKWERFLRFDLVAVGQRSGRDQFNGRNDDIGPAPMGVAFRIHTVQK